MHPSGAYLSFTQGGGPVRVARGELGTKNSIPIFNEMEYRGIEYSVVQGIGRQVWKWSVSLDTGVPVRDQAAIKHGAGGEAERAIDRALAPKKLRLVPPGDRD